MPPNFKRTPSGYLFRKVVPVALREIIGKSEFKVPCGKVYAQALARYHVEVVKAQQILDAARAKLSEQMEGVSVSRGRNQYPETFLKPITEVSADLVEQLRGFWLSGLEHDLAERSQGLDDEEYDELGQNIAEMQVTLGRAMSRGQVEVVLPSLHQIMHLYGYVLALRPEEERRLAYDFLNAVMEGYEILKKRHEGVWVDNPKIAATIPQFIPGERGASEKVEKGLTLGDVITSFLESYEKKPSGKEMLKKHRVALPLLGEMVGMKLPVAKLRQAHINGYFEEIQRLPSRWPDVCRQNKMSVLELLKNDKLLGTKGMAPKTFIDS